MTKSEQKQKVKEFIERGETIAEEEYHSGKTSFSLPYISGPLFEAWMNEIKIFNDRYLKSHPLYSSIDSTLFHYKTQLSSHKNMMGHLQALLSDDEYWLDEKVKPNTTLSIVDKMEKIGEIMTPTIFISHRSTDAEVADLLRDYLVSTGIPNEYIFCSSLPGNDVKHVISREVKDKIANSSVNIAILSYEYYESAYCTNEAGVIWFQEPKIPVIVIGLPEIEHSNMQGFLNSDYKLRRLDDANDISEIYDTVRSAVNISHATFAVVTAASQKLSSKYTDCIRKLQKADVVAESTLEVALSPLEQIKSLLRNPEEWVEEDGKYYHNMHTQYTIVLEDDHDENHICLEGNRMFYHHLQTDTRAYYGTLKLFCNGTQLFSCQITHLDGHRMTAPCPESKFIPYRKHRESIHLKYYVTDSIQYFLLKFLEFHIGNANGQEAQWATRKLLEVVLLFECLDDVEDFAAYVNNHLGAFDNKVFNQRKPYIADETDTAKEILVKEICNSLALKEMLSEWKQFKLETPEE